MRLIGPTIRIKLTIRTNVLEETCSCQKEQISLLQHQLYAANDKLQLADLSVMDKRTECEEQKKILQDLHNRLTEADMQIIDEEKLRKNFHNTILKCQLFHEASEEDVFVEISQLVQSALDGYKVCIFAYGQTGSGKTCTMMGKPEAREQKGLIPRSLEQIFQTSQLLSSQGWRYKMQASMLEIYNETIRDLLSTSRSSGPDLSLGKQYTIKHDANGNTHVSDLTVVDVCSIKQVSSLLHQAAQSRRGYGNLRLVDGSRLPTHQISEGKVDDLLLTEDSKSIRLKGTEQQVQSVLNLIDLAGSERLSKSGATGDRLKETPCCNDSPTEDGSEDTFTDIKVFESTPRQGCQLEN
ncbi:kinesin-like protein KIN-14N [Tasmannia lanceolata]|uniref:kinesin-like protein KIN-14N n=1 Tax=Tasmannia lanceolata TaxID=3420 RepID=UPI0040642C4B